MGEGLGRRVAEVLPVLDEPPDDLEGATDVTDRHDVGELVLDLPRGAPNRVRIVSSSTVSSPSTVAWSSSESASRADPSA